MKKVVKELAMMNGLEVVNKVYLDGSLEEGSRIVCGGKMYEVVKKNERYYIRQISNVGSIQRPAIHNLAFDDLLLFLNSEATISKKVRLSEAILLNKKIKPKNDTWTEFMTISEAFMYMADIKDMDMLKELLEDNAWYTE